MSPGKKKKPGRQVRVPFRRNRGVRRRQTDWTDKLREDEDGAYDAETGERVRGKGAISRQRTITVLDNDELPEGLLRGTVVAMRGLFADVDEGQRIWPCTVRRVLRTRLIDERHPVTVGDHVWFRPEGEGEGVEHEGVIEAVEGRRGQLCRRAGRRIHTIVANVDQAIIVSSAEQPRPKPHLIDRYMVASEAGDITPVVCMNKVDLDSDGHGRTIAERYRGLGYEVVCTSAVTGEGIDDLRRVLTNKASVIAGQSGVGKSSLLNAVQPGLQLKIGDINEQLGKGRHTTTTATLIRLEVGGYVVDTPGIRAFDLSLIDPGRFEVYFPEFVDRLADCKFPDCTHTHETGCAIKAAVENGEISPERYESYLHMFEEPGAA